MHFHTDWLGKFILLTTRWCWKLIIIQMLHTTYLDVQFLPSEALWEIRPVVIDVSNWDMHQRGGAARRGAVVAHQDGHLVVRALLVIQGHPADQLPWGAQSSVREDTTCTRIPVLRTPSRPMPRKINFIHILFQLAVCVQYYNVVHKKLVHLFGLLTGSMWSSLIIILYQSLI